MINEKNIFDQGMLINLQMGHYYGRMKLSDEQLKDLPKEIVRGVHDLFDNSFKTLLKNIISFENEIRGEVKKKSIPFPIDGVYFVNSIHIESIMEILESKKKQRQELIEKAADNYDEAIEVFSKEYPDFYKHATAKGKYLSKNQFLSKFYFKYQFIKITAPDKDGKFITPEMYKTEMKKFKEIIDEMKQEVINIIYQELVTMTERLKKQCSDGTPNQRTLNNLNLFLSQIDEVYSDFIDRDDLKAAIKKVKNQILGVDADDLRSDEDLKKKFKKKITSVINEIKALPDTPLTRSIDF